MSYTDNYDIFLENVPVGDKIIDCLKINYTIHTFNRLIENIIDEMIKPLIDMSQKHETNNIIFIGGPTQIKLLKNKFFFILKINNDENNFLNTDTTLYKTIVAKGGATIYQLINSKNTFTLLDIIPMNIGIASNKKMITMINKNSKIPTSVERIFTTQHDCQRSIDMDIYE